jgi:hypothetical protein
MEAVLDNTSSGDYETAGWLVLAVLVEYGAANLSVLSPADVASLRMVRAKSAARKIPYFLERFPLLRAYQH